MKNELTNEEVALMHSVRKEYIGDALTYSEIDKKLAVEFIDFIYSLAGLDYPEKMFVSSPLAAQVAANMFNEAQVRAQVWAQVWAQVRAQVRAQVWAQVWAQVRDQVWAQVWAQVRDQVWDQVRDQVRDQVWDQVRDQVWAQYFSFSSYGNYSDYSWVSFYDYFSQIGVLNHERFNKFKLLKDSGIYDMIQFKGLCIICEKPSKVITNDNDRLHNPEGAAIEWKDGYRLHFINGRALPSWIWEKEITKEMFLSERNAEIKGGMYAVLGQQRVFDMLDTEKIAQKERNNETLTLWKTREEIFEVEDKMAWVECQCPSTSTKYLLGVEPHHTCPIEAMASLWGVTEKEYVIDSHT